MAPDPSASTAPTITLTVSEIPATSESIQQIQDAMPTAAPPAIATVATTAFTPTLDSALSTNMDVPPPQAPPTPSTSTQQAPQGNTGAPGIEDAVGTRRRRVRKAHDLQLNACICGVTITDLEIEEGKTVMKCHAPGCETVWVSSKGQMMQTLDADTQLSSSVSSVVYGSRVRTA